jgi:hypothetical protein
MIPIPGNRILTADGEYQFVDEAGRPYFYTGKECLVEVDVTAPSETEQPEGEEGVYGSFDGASVELGYQGESGRFVPYRDGLGALSTTESTGWRVAAPLTAVIVIKVTGAGENTRLKASCVAVKP